MQNFTQNNAILVNAAVNGQTMGAVNGKLRGLALQDAMRPDTGSLRPQSDSYSRIGIGNPIPGSSPSSPAGQPCLFGTWQLGQGTGCGQRSTRERAERWLGHDRLLGHAQLAVDTVAHESFTAHAAHARAAANAAAAGTAAPAAAERRPSDVAEVRDSVSMAADTAKPALRTKRSSKPAAMPAPIWATLVLSRALSS
jgi:hypothetical protein